MDTNVFIAALTAEEGKGGIAKQLLDSGHEIWTGSLVLMEVRTVLAKKKQKKASKVNTAIQIIQNKVEGFVDGYPDIEYARKKQRETLLYPMDCLIYSTADEKEAVIVSFDTEMRNNGAVHPKYLI